MGNIAFRAALRFVPIWALCLGSCVSTKPSVEEPTSSGQLVVVLDANSHAVVPNRQIKFFVDITNNTSETLDLTDVSVELTASPLQDRSKIVLRKAWTYRLQNNAVITGRKRGYTSHRPVGSITLAPGKRLTLPIVPESSRVKEFGQVLTISEFPLQTLSPGEYEVRATVNEKFVSRRYRLEVYRPDLKRRHHTPVRARQKSSSR